MTAVDLATTSIGIEFGSTNIKAVLLGPDFTELASGSHSWENQFVDRTWTYSEDAIRNGLQSAYAALAAHFQSRHGAPLTTTGSIAVSAMMHGYLAFDAAGNLLTPFRTWRNTSTGAAAEALTAALDMNIPLRWSIAHLYQAMLDAELHVPQVASLNTLAGYVHHLLTGEFVLGVGDASGMFPIDSATCDWDAARLETFENLTATATAKTSVRPVTGLRGLLPRVLPAGAPAGSLSLAGAALLDPTGTLQPGIPFAPPEGDAGTGMVATNAVRQRTGNVSVGTSVFSMVVLERPLATVHPEIDLVTTPAGDAVAMVHCNNGASELGVWAGVFGEFAQAIGTKASMDDVFAALLTAADSAASDGGGILAFNNLSGETITGLDEGRPAVVRTPDSTLNLGNFARTQLYSVFAALALGMRTLADEGVEVDRLLAHGGLFRTPGLPQRILAAAVNAPVAVAASAGAGGAWGIAVLAAYSKAVAAGDTRDLAAFLDEAVFANVETVVAQPQPVDVEGFAAYLDRYAKALPIQAAAVATTA